MASLMASASTPAQAELAIKMAMAAEEGDEPAVARLLAVGADPNASVPGGTADGVVLWITALIGSVELVRPP
jgi:hypothetical protein